jgi:flagellar biosynthesis/type III secretory pathway ATPase
MLPGLLERAGNGAKGSITALYTVLVDGDDHNEPIADAVRAILDGHIVLSRDLAGHNHYPAIDIMQSVSRTIADVTDTAHRARVARIREWLSTLRDSEDLVSVGAYVKGANPRLDLALEKRDAVTAFLCQPADSTCRYADAVGALQQLAGDPS